MDRAHRLGQKKVVNVYRLLMRGTLEERIMSLQQFKLDVANTVVNADNVSTSTMDASNVIDKLAENTAPGGAATTAGARGAGDDALPPGAAGRVDVDAQAGQYGDFDMSAFASRVAGRRQVQ
jgi:TATA-binding protein-associated factor